MLRHASCILLLYTISKLLAYYMPFHQWTSLSYKSSNIHVKSMFYSQIWQNFGGGEYLCKLGKEYLNALLCKVYSLQHSETFWCIKRLSTTNRHWVINAQTDPVLLAQPFRHLYLFWVSGWKFLCLYNIYNNPKSLGSSYRLANSPQLAVEFQSQVFFWLRF